MGIRQIRARGTTGSEAVEQVVQKARAKAGVDRILVVYGEQTAHIYVEDASANSTPPRQRNNARAL